MKKFTAILIIAAFMLTLAALPAFAADMPGLVITEILRNPKGNDTYEGFEIMNASDAAIDLYNYRIFYRNGASVEENAAVAAADVKFYTYLAAAPGDVVLAPGEIAMVWCVYSDCYKKADPVYGGFVKDLGGGKVEYNVDAYRNDMKTDSGCELDPSVKVLINDKTGGKYFETKKAAVENGFNLENSGVVRMWVCPREGDITSATCIIDSLTAGKGVATSYEPQSGTPVMKATDSESFTPGVLDEKQTVLRALADSLGKTPATDPPATDGGSKPGETKPGGDAPATGDVGMAAWAVLAALSLCTAVPAVKLCVRKSADD